MDWMVAACLSALFAGASSVLAKCGIKKTDPDVAGALRTSVVFFFSWIMVFIVGSQSTISEISPRSLVFLVLSGLATGASWFCWFKALAVGKLTSVMAIDKSSTVLTVLLAVICFSETEGLFFKLIGAAALLIGALLMTDVGKKGERNGATVRSLAFAATSAVCAALTSVLAKVGITGVESNLGTAIRTSVVLVMAWLIVFAEGKRRSIAAVPHSEALFVALSGLATGASWICYYYAIQKGVVSVVVPIDKMSILVTVLFSRIILGERLSRSAAIGLALMVGGTLAIVFAA